MAGPQPFKVIRSEKVRQELQQSCASAKQMGLANQCAEALERIEEKLQNNPTQWGDPLFDLSHLGLRVYRGWHSMFLVHYGVDLTRRVVIVREYKLIHT